GYERWVAPVRAALGEGEFAAAWVEGQAIPVDDAVADALAIANELDSFGSSAVKMTTFASAPGVDARTAAFGWPLRSGGTVRAAGGQLPRRGNGPGGEGQSGRIENGDGEPRRGAAGVHSTAGNRRSGGS